MLFRSVKNLNTFRGVKLALEYEHKRQTQVLTSGGEVVRETRGWQEGAGETVSQRKKEEADDYRYFPEPDLPPLVISEAWVNDIAAAIPELPDAKAARFQSELGLSAYDAEVLVSDRDTAEWFEEAVRLAKKQKIKAKTVSNWVTGELFRLSGAKNISLPELSITQAELVKLLTVIKKGTISQGVGKSVLEKMVESGRSAKQIIKDEGLTQISDENALEQIVGEVLTKNPKEVQKYLNGKKSVAGYLMGQVMKATRGKANPRVVRPMIIEKLEAMR